MSDPYNSTDAYTGNAHHNEEGCAVLHCKQCAGNARLRTILKRSHTLRTATLEELAEGISNANLERIAKHFPAILSEAVRELNGEVEYIQHNLTK